MKVINRISANIVGKIIDNFYLSKNVFIVV